MDISVLFEVLKALLIGVVEGITEWLPISSTGHMILVDEFVKLNVSDEFLKLFLVVIQIGAILSVIILYFRKLNPFSRRKTADERKGTWKLWGMVVIGCIPAAVIGFALDDWVSEHFYNAYVVAGMLILYGIIFIVLERRNRMIRKVTVVKLRQEMIDNFDVPRGRHARVEAPEEREITQEQIDDRMFDIVDVEEIDWKTALKIGLFQCLAIIPGTSRSGAIIIGSMLMKCSRTAATEFAFFLAIPVMLGWGLVKAVKYIVLGSLVMTLTEIIVLIVGVVTAFVVSILAIKFLIGYIKKNDFEAFGWYRIVVGVIVLAYFLVKLFVLA